MECEGWEKPGPGLLNEGDMQVPVKPYEISYRSLLPKKPECENLLVISCFSASHVAYSSMRMEPQYMIVGHAAGIAASQAIERAVAPQDIDITVLQDRLREQKQILSLDDVIHVLDKLPGFVVDNSAAEVEGNWGLSSSIIPHYGFDYLHDDGTANETTWARFVPNLPKAGKYEVRFAYSADENRASKVLVQVNTAEGPLTLLVNEKKEQGPHAPFVSLGVFSLPEGTGGSVEVFAKGADGYVVADAVQWLPLE
jgi:hypothetical protein